MFLSSVSVRDSRGWKTTTRTARNPCKLNCQEISYSRYWLTNIRRFAPVFREPIDDELTGGKFVLSFSASLSGSPSSLSVCQSVQLRRRQQHRRSSLRVCTRASQHTRLVFESWRLPPPPPSPPPDACFSLAVVINVTPATEKKKFAILVKRQASGGERMDGWLDGWMDGSGNC